MKQKKKLKKLERLNNIKIGYARASSLDDRQKLGLAVQIDALKDCDHIFSEKQSGSNDDRSELIKAIELTKKLARNVPTPKSQIFWSNFWGSVQRSSAF